LYFDGFVTLPRKNQIDRLDPKLGGHNLTPLDQCSNAGVMKSSAFDQMALQSGMVVYGKRCKFYPVLLSLFPPKLFLLTL